VLTEIGVAADEVARLRKHGIIGESPTHQPA
jgi:hypothetical protein